MKNTAYILLFALILMFTGCNILDIKDNTAINPSIWDSEQSATLYLNTIYSLSAPEFSTNSNSSDETAPDFGDPDKLLGNLPSGSVGDFSLGIFQTIRNINIGLQEMEHSSMASPAKERILGQFYFLRAYQHWKLVNLYGGVPYVTKVVDAFGDYNDINAPRNKTSECIQFLKDDLTKAIHFLPAKWNTDNQMGGYGRASSVAAAALLGRILLFYASPQFNPLNDRTRWQEAYDANVLAKKLADENGYGLFTVTETIPGVGTKDINQIFRTKGNKEVIFARTFMNGLIYNGYEGSTRPAEADVNVGLTQEPSNCPSLELAKAFPMADGSPYIVPSSPTVSNAFSYIYKGRDPRFYSTIVYGGAIYPLANKVGRIQWLTKTLDGVTNDSYRSRTGFYCRKLIDPSLPADVTSKGFTDWVEIRYAELLLNVAECAVELGKPDEMVTLIGQLRDRAGIAPGSDGKYGLTQYTAAGYSPIEIVMRERQIELAFENKRYWDLRRRNMFSTDLGSVIKKLNGFKRTSSRLTVTLATGKTAAQVQSYITSVGGITAAIDILYRDYFIVKASSISPLAKSVNYLQPYPIVEGSPSYNFFDIPDAILQRSPEIKQTLGWPGGTFNPFE